VISCNGNKGRIYTKKEKDVSIVPRKGKMYPLFREEIREVQEFIEEQLRKEYIRPSKLSQ